jgi:hypothetical protein
MAAKKAAAQAEAPPREKERAKFFHNLKPIRVHMHMKAPRREKEDPWLTLLFRMTLDGNLVRSAPDFIQTAYDGIAEHDEDHVGLKRAIENVTIEIHETDRTKVTQTLSDVMVYNMEVKEIESSKGDPSIVLTFQVDYPAEAELWRFMRTHFAMEAFVVFDSAQAFLLALEEEPKKKDDEKQGALKMPMSGKDQAAGETEETEAAFEEEPAPDETMEEVGT